MLKLFDGACQKTEPHVCVSRSHWPLWKRFVDWLVVKERRIKIFDAVRADGKMIAPEVIARIYRHRIFFDRYFSNKYFYTGKSGAIPIWQPWWSRVPLLKEIGEWWKMRRWKNVTVEMIHHRGYHGEKPKLTKFEQRKSPDKETS